MTKTILEQIVAAKHRALEARKLTVPLADLICRGETLPLPLSLTAALKGKGFHLITEIKCASPSRGIIRTDFDPVAIALIYARHGAAAISVLTEANYFQGRLAYLGDIREALGERRPPLLRKDFIDDAYQVYESRAYGADSLLLIAAILTPEKLRELLRLSGELGMDCLVETHNEAEMETALESGAEIIGINNRDLGTFKVDINTTERLCRLVPPGKIVVSESGVRDRGDIVKLKQWGVTAALVGEALMMAPDIGAQMEALRDPD
jgi:indole-3-glycerol phosphate synthase